VERASLDSWIGETINLTLIAEQEYGEDEVDYLEEVVVLLGVDDRFLFCRGLDGRNQVFRLGVVFGWEEALEEVEEAPEEAKEESDQSEVASRLPTRPARKMLF